MRSFWRQERSCITPGIGAVISPVMESYDAGTGALKTPGREPQRRWERVRCVAGNVVVMAPEMRHHMERELIGEKDSDGEIVGEKDSDNTGKKTFT